MGCKTCKPITTIVNDINNTISNTTTSVYNKMDDKSCFESRFSNKQNLYKIRKVKIGASKDKKECCEEIDLSSINLKGEWIDGECLVENNLQTGYKRRDIIKVTSKETSNEYTIPLDATPYLISSTTKLSLKESIELLNNRIIKSDDCRNEFCNDELTVTLTRDCPPGSSSTSVEYTIPECTIISNISKEHANMLAQLQLAANSRIYAICNAECVPNTKYCNDEISETRIKQNCPIGKVGLEVTYTVEAGRFCSLISKDKANEQAQYYLDRNIDRYILTSDPCLYCADPTVVCNDEYSEVLNKDCSGSIVSTTYNVAAGKYCLTANENRTEAQAKTQANQQAIDEVNRNRAAIIASLQCPTQCNTQVLVGNIRNTKTSSVSNTYNNPLDYTVTWTQTYIDLFESQPAVQVLKGGFNVLPALSNRYRLELYRNNTKIIDSGTFIDDQYFQLVYNVELGDEIRYVLTFEKMFGLDVVQEATQRIGCPPAIENLITRVFNEGDGI